MANNARVTLLLTAKDMTGRALNSAKAGLVGLRKSAVAQFTGIQGAINTAVGGAAIAAVGTYVLRVTREFERLGNQLAQWSGSAERAGAVFTDLRQLATELPFELTELTQAWINLQRAGIDPSRESLVALADVASAMGSNIQDVTHAIGRAAMGEFDPLESAAGVRLLVKDGNTLVATFRGVRTEIGRDAGAIREYLVGIGKTEFEGASAERMKTLDGQISNLMDSLAELAMIVSGAGLRDGFSGLITDATDLTQALIENGAAVAGWTRILMGVGGTVLHLVTAPLQTFWNLLQTILRVGGMALTTFATAVSKVGAGTLRLAAAMKEAAGGDGSGLRAMADQQTAWAAEYQRQNAALFAGIKTDLADTHRGWLRVGNAVGLVIRGVQDLATAEGRLRAKRGGAGGLGNDSTNGNPTGGGDPEKEAEKARKAYQERIAALLELSKHESTRPLALRLLAREDAKLTEQLRAGNLSLEERARLMGLRADARGALTGPLKIVEQVSDPREARQRQLGGALALAGTPGLDDASRTAMLEAVEQQLKAAIAAGAPAQELVGMLEQLDDVQARLGRHTWAERLARSITGGRTQAEGLRDTIDGIAQGSLTAFGGAVEAAFSAVATGSQSAGAAFSSAMVGAVADAARAMGQYALGLAAVAVGKAIGGDVRAVASAAKLTAAGVGLMALAGTLGGAARSIGAGGNRAGGAGDRDSRDMASSRGETALYIEGGLLDMNDPRQEAAFVAALESLSGRRVTVRTAPGG